MSTPLQRRAVTVFFILFLTTGLFLVKDYGISWDEPRSRLNGIVTYNYVAGGDESLFSYSDRHYGTFFELALVSAEKALGLKDSREVFLMRHTATFLVFFIGVFFFYLICKDHFKNENLGILGAMFLVLSPRIFAESFYNSKDLVFLSFFIVSIYTMIRMLDRKTALSAALHAMVSGMAIDIRVAGILLPVLTCFFFLADTASGGAGSFKDKRTWLVPGVYLFSMTVFTVAFWPYLWRDPAGNFLEALAHMRQFPWPGENLFMGSCLSASRLPWYYMPAWMLITTPPVYTLFFLAGMTGISRRLFTRHAGVLRVSRDELVFLSWLFIPMAAAIAARSVLYDGWRHMFFVYPAFLLVSVSGVADISGILENMRRPLKVFLAAVLSALTAVKMGSVVFFMAYDHPYQNLYFNFLAGKDMREIKERYDLDYWGLSYREALEYILANDKRGTIKVFAANPPGEYNALILEEEERKRLEFVSSIDEADYFISNYRWHKGEYELGRQPFYAVTVGGARIMVVYKK